MSNTVIDYLKNHGVTREMIESAWKNDAYSAISTAGVFPVASTSSVPNALTDGLRRKLDGWNEARDRERFKTMKELKTLQRELAAAEAARDAKQAAEQDEQRRIANQPEWGSY